MYKSIRGYQDWGICIKLLGKKGQKRCPQKQLTTNFSYSCPISLVAVASQSAMS